MAYLASPGQERTKDTRKRLENCWELDLTWKKYPKILENGCKQVAKAMSVPPSAILGGLLILTSFVLSPSVIKVPGTDWVEPILLWITISMPTGSRKTTVYHFLRGLLQKIRKAAGCKDSEPEWLLQDATFEKMGALMSENGGRLLGMYDELSAFLTKIKLYNSRGLTDSHELAMFLELYNATPWTRTTVTGEANFAMEKTCLTVGGFNQPAVARALIELPGNAEKGLSQRFLWLFPKPAYGNFNTLEPTDEKFTDQIVVTLAQLWRKTAVGRESEVRVFELPGDKKSMKTFTRKYDEVQKQLSTIAAMDDLLSGMLSKSLGQILRVSVAMHVLFSIDESGDEDTSDEDEDSDSENEEADEDKSDCVIVNGKDNESKAASTIVSKKAMKAAIDFVQVCCQHTAHIAGRGSITEELAHIEKGPAPKHTVVKPKGSSLSNEAFTLSLPGKCLDVSNLCNKKKKYRNRGGVDGALEAMRKLENEGLGKLIVKNCKGSVKTWEYHKADIPEDTDGKIELAKKLDCYGISIQEYSEMLCDKLSGKRPPPQDEKIPTTPLKHPKTGDC